MYLRDDLKQAYKSYFKLSFKETESMTFHDAYDYADAIFSIRFHGYEGHSHWDKK